MIIGLTGKNAAGKGEAAKYMQKKGFVYFSLSDELRDEAAARDIEHSRENLIRLGNELREKFGSNYLAGKINQKIQKKVLSGHIDFFVVDSIRNPYEIEELRRNRDFVLVAVKAPIELRFKRLLERKRLGDAKTLEEFRKQEEKENLNSETSQQLDTCIKMADRTIVNDGTIEELHNKIDLYIKNPP